MLVKLLLVLVILALEFVASSLPYKIHKRLKDRNKLEIISICISSIAKMCFVYLCVVILLKIKLNIPFSYSLQSMFTGKLAFIAKFHAISLLFLVAWTLLARWVEFEIKLTPAQHNTIQYNNSIFSAVCFFVIVFFASLYIYMGKFFPPLM